MSPGEIKRREVSWTLRKKLAQRRSRTGWWCWARERESWTSFASVVGHCDSVLHNSWDSNCVVRRSLRNAGLVFWRRFTAALVFRVGACFEVSLFYSPFFRSSPSLIGLKKQTNKQTKTKKLGVKHQVIDNVHAAPLPHHVADNV